MILTHKVRINPPESVKRVLWFISDLCRQVWNLALQQRRDPKSWGRVNVYTQKKELVELKAAFSEFKRPSSQVLQNVLFDLEGAYQSFFTKYRQGDKEARPPRYKPKPQFVRQRYSQREVSFEIVGSNLKLAYGSKPSDWLEMELPPGGYDCVKTVDIVFQDGIWSACMTYRVAEPALKTVGEVLYFDPGSRMALTGIKTSGEFVEYDLGPLRQLNRSTYGLLDELISQRDKKQKGSYHWRRLNQRIKRLFRKIATRSRVYLHKLAKQILADHPQVKAFWIGNWKKQETLADTGSKYVNKRINRAVQNQHPLEKLIEYLTYKAKLKGQAIQRFDERGTTRSCAACDHVHPEGLPPKVRIFVCEECRFRYSRDHHSGLNFVKRYEPALWQRLSGQWPDRSRRRGLNPFSFKPWGRTYLLPVPALADAPHF